MSDRLKRDIMNTQNWTGRQLNKNWEQKRKLEHATKKLKKTSNFKIDTTKYWVFLQLVHEPILWGIFGRNLLNKFYSDL